MAKKHSDTVMTIDELAEYLKLSKSMLYHFARTRRTRRSEVAEPGCRRASAAVIGAAGSEKPPQLRRRICRLVGGRGRKTSRLRRSWPVALALIAAGPIAACLAADIEAGTTDPETNSTSRSVPAAGETPGDAELERLWQKIGQDDHRVAYPAVDKLARGGDRAVRILARQIEPLLRNANERAAKQLVAELDDERFSVRNRASEQLAMMGRWAERLLRTGLRETGSQEARARLAKLIRAAESPTAATDGRRRMVRAVWILQRIGTARAKALLGSIERSLLNPHWRCFRAGEHVVEAGFVPEKVEYVWGEPMFYFTFVVKNVAAAPLQFTEGGDYRGGRSESHKITAVDANGQAVPAPEMHRMGGLVGMQKVPPGGIYLKMLPVSRRLTFRGPGVYTVTGSRTLQLGGLDGGAAALGLPVATSFRLTIHPYSKARMQQVVDNLAAQIRAAGSLAPRPLEFTEPTAMSQANRLHLAMSALAGIRDGGALRHFIAMAKDAAPQLRVAALKRLGGFSGEEALAVLLGALRGREPAIRAAAAEALGSNKSEGAVEALIAALPKQEPAVAAAVLRAMGHTRSPRVFEILVRSLGQRDERRRGAVEALVAFGTPKAIKALKAYVNDDDMGFREFLIRKLAESLRQPIDARWLVPVIRSRKAVGDAGRLLRLYAGPKAVPALLSCLDPNDPSVQGYYNQSIVYAQGWCQGGLRIPWISDLNRSGTPEEIRQNRKTLSTLKAWVAHYYRHRLDEKPEPRYRGWREEDSTWGPPVDGISIRIRVNQRVWPEGMPQVVFIDVRGHPNEGTVHLLKMPEPLEVELNGHWYARKPPRKTRTMGISPGHGASFHNLRLSEKWRRKSDDRPMWLTPRRYTIRVRLSTPPKDRRTDPAVSKPIHFEIIPTHGPWADGAPASATQPADGGVQVRLRADKRIWKVGEVPIFQADVKGGATWRLPVAEPLWRLEVDGRACYCTGKSDAWQPGGKTYANIPLRLDGRWRLGRGDRLTLQVGKHTIRLGVRPSPAARGSSLKPPIAWSSPVEIEVSAPPAATDSREDEPLCTATADVGKGRTLRAVTSRDYRQSWLLRRGAPAKWELLGDNFDAMAEVHTLRPSPDGRYLAVVSVGEGALLLQVVDLERLLKHKQYKVLHDIVPFPGWVEVVRWDGGRLIVKSDTLLTHRDEKSGRVSPLLELDGQTYSLRMSDGAIVAVSAEARDPVAAFVKKLSDDDPGVRSEAAMALACLKAPSALPALKKALAAEKDPDVRPDMLQAARALAAAAQFAAAAQSAATKWGQLYDGLQMGLRYTQMGLRRTSRGGQDRHGETVTYEVWIHNSTDEDVTLAVPAGSGGIMPRVRDGCVEIDLSRIVDRGSSDEAATIPARETKVIKAVTLWVRPKAKGTIGWTQLCLAPGRYKVFARHFFESGGGKIRNAWVGDLSSGDVVLQVLPVKTQPATRPSPTQSTWRDGPLRHGGGSGLATSPTMPCLFTGNAGSPQKPKETSLSICNPCAIRPRTHLPRSPGPCSACGSRVKSSHPLVPIHPGSTGFSACSGRPATAHCPRQDIIRIPLRVPSTELWYISRQVGVCRCLRQEFGRGSGLSA